MDVQFGCTKVDESFMRGVWSLGDQDVFGCTDQVTVRNCRGYWWEGGQSSSSSSVLVSSNPALKPCVDVQGGSSVTLGHSFVPPHDHPSLRPPRTATSRADQNFIQQDCYAFIHPTDGSHLSSVRNTALQYFILFSIKLKSMLRFHEIIIITIFSSLLLIGYQCLSTMWFGVDPWMDLKKCMSLEETIPYDQIW